MNDKLLTAVEEHVAFHGPQGCNVESLWPVMQAIEADKTKCWSVLIGMNSLDFYNHDRKIAQSCKRQLAQADNLLRIVAPDDLRKKILTQGAQHDHPLNANQFAVLDKIACARSNGILQIQVARELGVDSRAVYPVIKRLDEYRLIVKKRVSTNTTWTNLLYHIRFAPDESANRPMVDSQGIIHYDTMKEQLVAILSKATDEMIPMAELFKIFGFTTLQQKKWASRFFTRAVEEGYIEKKKLLIDGCKTVCIKLLHSPGCNDPTPEPPPRKRKKKQYGQLNGKDLEDRVLGAIAEADAQGMTRRQVEDALPEATPSAIKLFLNRVVSMNNDDDDANNERRLFHVIEAQGRGRCYRYFTRSGLQAFLKNRGQSFAQKQPGDTNAAERIGGSDEQSSAKKRASHEPGSGQDEPLPKKAKTTTTGGFIKGTRQSMKGTNVTMDNRRNAMATIVQRDKVRELHGDLRDEIMAQTGESDSNHVIARATLVRMAQSLERADVLRIVKMAVPTSSGGVEPKILLLVPELNENDNAVQQYLERMRMNRMVKPIASRKQPEPEVYNRTDAPAPVADKMTPRQQSVTEKVYAAPDRFWREVALRHGWLSSRWRRARLLHEYLFGARNSSDAVDFGHVISHMPLRVYREAFGICSYSDAAEEFLRTNDNPEMPLSMIPTELQPTIISISSRLRHKLFRLMAILEALELVKPHTVSPGPMPEPAADHQPTIILTRIGRIRNFLDTARPVLKEITLDTIDDIKKFWDELEFTCTCEYTRTTGTPRHANSGSDILSSITIPRTWSRHVLLNSKQRQVLESHVDREQGKAPCDDDKLILHVARQTCLAPTRVKRYFEGIVRLHHGGAERQPRKTRPSQMVSSLLQAAVSGDKVQGYKSKNIERTFTPTRRYLRHRFHAASDEDLSQPTRPKHLKRWTEPELHVLIHAYAIMRQRADVLHIPISWKPIEQVLPDWDYETCRRRLHHTKFNYPHTNQEIANLKRHWATIYRDGIQSAELVDERPWDVVNFDLQGQLEYFLMKLQSLPRQSDAPVDCLPESRQMFMERFDVVPRISYGPTETAFTSHGHDTRKKSDSGLISDTHLHIAVLIKMILLTATIDYDPKAAHKLLDRFSPQEIDNTTTYLRDAGVLIKNRKFGANRLIPGRQYNFSEKFLKTFTCPFYPSQLLQQSGDFYHELRHKTELNQYQLSGGTMAVVLDMLSAGQLTLQMKDEQQYFQTRRDLPMPVFVEEGICATWINRGFTVSLEAVKSATADGHGTEQPDNDIIVPSMELLDTLDISARHIYDLLDSYGVEGATLLMLKERLDMPDKSIIQATHNLISHSLAVRVGFSDLRLITTRHVEQWAIRFGDNAYCRPRMWRNVHGNTIPAVLEGCAEAILKHVLSKPGITQSQLCGLFEGFMAASEVADVIEYLEQRGSIKSQQFYQTAQKVGLFSRRNFSKRRDNEEIKDNVTIHYWPLSGYYQSVNVTH